MNISNPLDKVFELGVTVIEKIWPDPTKRAIEMRKLEELRQNGDLEELRLYVESHTQLMLAQANINLQDAKSGNIFQAGWRPAIGWVGAISLALMYIPKAIMLTFIWSWQNIAIIRNAEDVSVIVLTQFPNLGATDIIGLLGSLLGVAVMRSYDKKQGTDTKAKP